MTRFRIRTLVIVIAPVAVLCAGVRSELVRRQTQVARATALAARRQRAAQLRLKRFEPIVIRCQID
jgi:hypothetical protein